MAMVLAVLEQLLELIVEQALELLIRQKIVVLKIYLKLILQGLDYPHM